MDISLSNQIQVFKNVFKSREDVFAIRWVKENKSGYMPAYHYDPYRYRAHRMKGGTFQNYDDKTYLKLTDHEISKHINGEQLIGVYPLLLDNTSYFLAADFDKADWINDARKFIKSCLERNIPAYLERSRSGKGGHVWIFFDKPYPAIRSRNIFKTILEESGVFSVFDKGSSFDRLFPNQDFLSGKGLGNLIALPLFKTTLEQGNSCFINPETEIPFSDQFEFLKSIRRISIVDLDQQYQTINTTYNAVFQNGAIGKLKIFLRNEVHISRDGITTSLVNFLKEELNFGNSEFIIKKKSEETPSGQRDTSSLWRKQKKSLLFLEVLLEN